MSIHTVDMYKKMGCCEVLLYVHCMSGTNDLRSAITIQEN